MMNVKYFLVFVVAVFFTINAIAQDNPKDIISRHKVVFDHPPQKIPVEHSVDAPLLGNGFTGVAISGTPEKQVFYVARNDFWRLKSSFNQSFPAVLGKIKIEIPMLENATYRIVQDLYEAKTHSTFQKEDVEVEISSYVSAAEDVMVIELHNKSKKTIEGAVNLEMPGESELIDDPPFNLVFDDDRKEGKDLWGQQRQCSVTATL